MRSFLVRISGLFLLTALALFATKSQAASNWLFPATAGGPVIPAPATLSVCSGLSCTGNSINTYSFPNAAGTGLTTVTGQNSPMQMPQFPDIQVQPPAGATNIAPYGQGVGGLSPTGNTTWNYPPSTIDVSPPSGSALPGTPPAIEAPFAPVADLGQGSGSDGTAMLDALSGIRQGAVVAGAVLSNASPVKAILVAAAVGTAGYALYQYFQANHLGFDANGNITAAPKPSCIAGAYLYGPATVSSSGITCPSGQTSTYGSGGSMAACGTSDPYLGSTYTAYCLTTPVPSAKPATQDQVDPIMQSAPPSVVADGAAVTQKLGIPFPNLPLDNALSPISVSSPTVNTGQSTDSVGNTIQTQGQNVGNFTPPSTLQGPPTITETTNNTVVNNGTPVSSSSSPVSPLIISNGVPIGTSGSSSQTDLCALHPSILACSDISVLNDVASSVLPASTVSLATVQPVVVGPQIGVCPPPLVLSMFGASMTLDLTSTMCNFASAIKPFNIAAAGLASIFILIGAFKNG